MSRQKQSKKRKKKEKEKKVITLVLEEEKIKGEKKKKKRKKEAKTRQYRKEKIKGEKKKEKERRRSQHVGDLEVNSKGVFRSSFYEFSLPSFPFILGRKLFGGLGEKTPKPHHLFSFLPTQLSTFQKSFPSYFLSKVFHPPYFTFKQTHPKGLPPIHKGPPRSLVGIMTHLVMSDLLIYPFSLKELTHTQRDPRPYQKRIPFIYLLFVQTYIL